MSMLIGAVMALVMVMVVTAMALLQLVLQQISRYRPCGTAQHAVLLVSMAVAVAVSMTEVVRQEVSGGSAY